MHSISKLCADHLRTLSNKHGIKLKSGHAHELVAAFFGYKSKAALLADTFFPINNIKQTNILLLTPSFMDERRKLLEGLAFELPDSSLLVEDICLYLESIDQFSGKYFKTWKNLAEALTKEYLQQHGNLVLPVYYKNISVFDKPIFDFDPAIEATDNQIKLNIKNAYEFSNHKFSQRIEITLLIVLFRSMRHIGYSKAEISLVDCSSHSNQVSGMWGKL